MINTQNKRLIKLFLDLVRIDSPTGEEKEIAEYLVNFVKANSLANEVGKDKHGNVFAKIAGEGEPLFFAAHMDTVEPGRGVKPIVKNGYITSDGTTILGGDNKIAIAAIIETLFQLKEKPGKHRPLEVLFTYSEEVGSLGALNFDYSRFKAKAGFAFDMTKPVGTIITASPYYERFDLEIVGKEAHASRPKEAINALQIFKEFLSRITLGPLDEDSILNIGIIQGGFARNTIPGKMLIRGELRSFNEKKLNKHKQNVINSIEIAIKKYQAKYKLEFVRENGGYKYSAGQYKHIVKKLENHGFKSDPIYTWGCSDVNIFTTKGLFCLNMGDGGEGAHTTDERIKITQFQELVRLMFCLVKSS